MVNIATGDAGGTFLDLTTNPILSPQVTYTTKWPAVASTKALSAILHKNHTLTFFTLSTVSPLLTQYTWHMGADTVESVPYTPPFTVGQYAIMASMKDVLFFLGLGGK